MQLPWREFSNYFNIWFPAVVLGKFYNLEKNHRKLFFCRLQLSAIVPKHVLQWHLSWCAPAVEGTSAHKFLRVFDSSVNRQSRGHIHWSHQLSPAQYKAGEPLKHDVTTWFPFLLLSKSLPYQKAPTLQSYCSQWKQRDIAIWKIPLECFGK